MEQKERRATRQGEFFNDILNITFLMEGRSSFKSYAHGDIFILYLFIWLDDPLESCYKNDFGKSVL